MASFKAKMKKKLPSVGKDMDLHTLLVEGVTPDSYFRKILKAFAKAEHIHILGPRNITLYPVWFL